MLAKLFPTGAYPEGEIVKDDHGRADSQDINTSRTTAAEHRYLKRLHQMDDHFLSDYRQGAEIHRQVRQWTQKTVKPGQTLTQLAADIEEGVWALAGHQGIERGDFLKAGMGFPTGICLNNVAAHYTPNPGGKDIVLSEKDVMTIDFGVHVNGWIVDSAFTMAWDPVYDNLLASVRDATNTGVKVRSSTHAFHIFRDHDND